MLPTNAVENTWSRDFLKFQQQWAQVVMFTSEMNIPQILSVFAFSIPASLSNAFQTQY